MLRRDLLALPATPSASLAGLGDRREALITQNESINNGMAREELQGEKEQSSSVMVRCDGDDRLEEVTHGTVTR